jgi:Protein of unknown function (DUF3489)
MKTFTIDTDNNIIVHTSRKAARETGAGVFATEEQFADLIGPDNKRLVEVWNSLAGVKPVTKFANRKVATERIWKAIQSLGEQAAAPVPATPFDEPEALAAPGELPVAEPAPDAGEEPAANVDAQEPQGAPADGTATENATPAKKTPKAKKAPKPPKTEESAGPRDGSKTARVVAMLKREGGATLEEIMQQMVWQKHTVRGFMAGAMKKAGYTVESFKSEAGARSYRINK